MMFRDENLHAKLKELRVLQKSKPRVMKVRSELSLHMPSLPHSSHQFISPRSHLVLDTASLVKKSKMGSTTVPSPSVFSKDESRKSIFITPIRGLGQLRELSGKRRGNSEHQSTSTAANTARGISQFSSTSMGQSHTAREQQRFFLKKVDEKEKQQMQFFHDKFSRSERMEQVLNFSRDSDFFYERDINKDDDDANDEDDGQQFRDSKKHIVVGPMSQMNFFNHHKQIDRIRQENRMYSIQDSIFTKMLTSQEKLNLLPRKLGIIKAKGDESIIALNHYTLGDRYAEVFSQGINSSEVSDRIKKLELMNNGLTDKGVALILKSLSKKTEELILSKNVIGSESIDLMVMILRNKEYSLRRLNLDNTRLGDACAIRLLEALKKLTYLDLSNNRLTDECSGALASAISIRCPLNELYLHWNRLTGTAGERIVKALFDNQSLKVLDLSNNSMGLHNGEGCANEFAKLFGKEESDLIHLDLSNNRWTLEQVKIIMEGINANQAIYGFHMDSKFTRVDEFGFLRLLDEYKSPEILPIDPNSALAAAANTTSTVVAIDSNLATAAGPQSDLTSSKTGLKGNGRLDSFHFDNQQQQQQQEQSGRAFIRINGLLPLPQKQQNQMQKPNNYLNVQSINLLSQQNQQQQQQQQSQQSFKSSNNNCCWICDGWSEQTFIWKGGESGQKIEGPVFVHMEFQSFRAIPLSEDGRGNYYVRRMCPPAEKLLYFFSMSKGEFYARDQHSTKNKTPLLKDVVFGDGSKRNVTVKYFNYKHVLRFEGSLFSHYFEPLHISVYPRDDFTYSSSHAAATNSTTSKRAGQKKKWSKESSVFSKYQQDNDMILGRAMDADWNNSKIPRFVKDPVDRKKLFELIKPLYEGLKAVYKYYSSFSPIGDVWAISKLLFIEIFTKSGLVDNKTLKLADLEIKFITSKTSHRKFRGMVPDRGMVRHEFLEGIIRIAEEKYMINGEIQTYTEACTLLLRDGFHKVIAEVENPAQWRDDRYWNEECDFCYKYYMQILMAIFEQYENTIRTSLPKSKYLNLFEFKKIFTDTSIMSDPHANERNINMAFNFSVQTQEDEVYDERILQLHFIEFMEALARAAEKFSLAPYKQLSPNELVQKEEEMTWDDRIQQPLHRKIENLIKLIFYQAFAVEQQEQFELQELSIFDQKEINASMTAPMRQKVLLVNTNNVKSTANQSNFPPTPTQSEATPRAVVGSSQQIRMAELLKKAVKNAK